MFHRRNRAVSEERANMIQIDYFLDRLKVSILEYHQTNVQVNVSPLLGKLKLDTLSNRLDEFLKFWQNGGYPDHIVIPRMLETKIFYQLAEISPLDYELFQPLVFCFKKLTSYTINETNIPHVYEIGEVLGRYLYGFTNYNSLVGHQQVYLHRLVTDILKILNKYAQFLQIWLLSEGDSSFAKFVSKIPQNGRIPLYLIIRNFLIYANTDEFNQERHIIEFFRLSRESSSFFEWCQESCNIIGLIIGICVPLINQASYNQNDVFANYFRIFCSIVESCNSKTGNFYYSQFEKQVINIVLVTESCDLLTFSMLETLISSPTIEVLEKLFANSYMVTWIIDKLDDQDVLHMLSLLFRKHEKVLLRMLSNNKRTRFVPHPVSVLGAQVMNITERDPNSVSLIMLQTVKDMREISMFMFNSGTPLSKTYLSMIVNYFQNQPTVNNFLNEFSSVIFLKLNFLNNENARSIIEFLCRNYFEFVQLFQKHEKYKYDSLEPNNLHVNKDYFDHRTKLLKEVEGTIDSDDGLNDYIDYSILENNLQLFKIFISQLYVHSKFKHIVYNNSNHSHYSTLLK